MVIMTVILKLMEIVMGINWGLKMLMATDLGLMMVIVTDLGLG